MSLGLALGPRYARAAMRGFAQGLLVFVFSAGIGCGGSTPPPAAPEPEPEPVAEPTPLVEPTPAPEDDQDESKKGEPAPAAEPEFSDDMTVEQAIAAVPQGMERANLDPDALSEPLADMKLYEPCKAKANEHVKIRVAIWNGKAVGVDVSVTPKNDKLASCVEQQIRGASWRDKVRSLNTVEYAF